MTELNVLTAIIAASMTVMVGVGFLPIVSYPLARWSRWVIAGVVVIMVTSALRQTYWDFLQHILGSDWPAFRDFLGGQRFSTVFNLGTILACWLCLVGRLYLIPEGERSGWHWWTAWMHPCERCKIFSRNKKE